METRMIMAALISILVSVAALSAAAPTATSAAARVAADTAKPATPRLTPGSAAPIRAALAGAAATANRDSVQAKRYRVTPRPFDKEEMKAFLTFFDMHNVAKPESTAVNRVYRDKNGAVLAYEPGISEIGYANEKVPILGPDDIVPDSLIRGKTDPLLKNLLKGRAERYVFANYEVTYLQSRTAEGSTGVGPAKPAFYTGRYVRKVDERVVLGDAFQIRIGYGERGAVQAFSFRDPTLVEAGSVPIPTRVNITDSLSRWAKSKTRTRRLTYPYHADKLRVLALKPLRVIDSYVLTQEKFRESPEMDGVYLMPSVTVLAQATIAAPTRKHSEPAPPDPVILHFHFPCRPGAGLCWPDHGRDIPATAPAPAAPRPAFPANPGAGARSSKPEIPASTAPPPK